MTRLERFVRFLLWVRHGLLSIALAAIYYGPRSPKFRSVCDKNLLCFFSSLPLAKLYDKFLLFFFFLPVNVLERLNQVSPPFRDFKGPQLNFEDSFFYLKVRGFKLFGPSSREMYRRSLVRVVSRIGFPFGAFEGDMIFTRAVTRNNPTSFMIFDSCSKTLLAGLPPLTMLSVVECTF